MWTPSDESLLAGMGSGDPDAATAFIRRFQRRVFGLALAILGDRGAAEDAAQETFARAWRNADAYDPRRGAVATWLLTIARNVSIDLRRLRRPDPVDPGVLVAMIESAAGAVETNDPYVATDQARRLRAALGALPDEQKRALVLASFYGLTTREIGTLEDAPQGTVKTRIRSALIKLRSELQVDDER